MKKGVITKGIEALVSFEINLLLFRLKKFGEYIKMYFTWWRFAGKQARDKFYRSKQ